MSYRSTGAGKEQRLNWNKSMRAIQFLVVFAAMLVAGQAQAVIVLVSPSSDDWGDPAIGLSGNPTDGFLRVFGQTGSPGFPIRRGAFEFDISSIPIGATINSANLFSQTAEALLPLKCSFTDTLGMDWLRLGI